jgi:hypothetical protein
VTFKDLDNAAWIHKTVLLVLNQSYDSKANAAENIKLYIKNNGNVLCYGDAIDCTLDMIHDTSDSELSLLKMEYSESLIDKNAEKAIVIRNRIGRETVLPVIDTKIREFITQHYVLDIEHDDSEDAPLDVSDLFLIHCNQTHETSNLVFDSLKNQSDGEVDIKMIQHNNKNDYTGQFNVARNKNNIVHSWKAYN